MKFLCYFLILLVPLTAIAAESAKHSDGTNAPPQQQQQKKTILRQPEAKTASPPTHRQFQPSERIEADTVIAFPVDI